MAEMKLLGVILAGGQSRRFGSDKAMAMVDGKALLDHVADALRPQVDALVVAGREWPPLISVKDLPELGIGPLGGLAGGLAQARRHGFNAVVSSGCDLIGIPQDLVRRLGEAPAIVDDQPLLGIWPVALGDALTQWLAFPENRSVYRFANHIGARRVVLNAPVRNANRPEDVL